MVSEKPPRRSKTEKEPVTIDLAAEASETIAEPVRSNDTDEMATAATSATTEDSIKPETSATVSDAPVSEAIDDQPVKEAKPEQDQATATDQPQPEAPEPAMVAAEPEPSQALPRRTTPATSTLVAAGIFGGIVALLLAGSMQYAGYLPSSSQPSTADTSSLTSEIAALRQQVQGLANRPANPDTSLASRVSALESAGNGASEQALTALRAEIAQLRTATQTATSSNSAITQRLEQTEAKLNDRGPEQQVARAIAAAALKAAIDRGGKFEVELQTFASVAADDPAVAELQPFAAAGVPSRTELQREFPRMADMALEATIQRDPNEGLGSRLLNSALSVVKVRRVGDVQGETPEAIIARMEEKLRNGDLSASVAEWNSLPDAAKTASQEFKRKLDARIQVENLVGGTLTRAVAGTQG